MICPYMFESVETEAVNAVCVQGVSWEDSDGEAQHDTTYVTPCTRTTKMIPNRCMETGCAAWQNGHCVRTS